MSSYLDTNSLLNVKRAEYKKGKIRIDCQQEKKCGKIVYCLGKIHNLTLLQTLKKLTR